MEFFELTCKRVTTNTDGQTVETHVVGPKGTWTIKDAAELGHWKKAKFFFRGEDPTDLDKLSVCNQ
jgi:hypothetical protein